MFCLFNNYYSSRSSKPTFTTPTPLAGTPSPLTDQNKANLTHCPEAILLAREDYFPATITEMYDPDRMDTEFLLVRQAHDTPKESLRERNNEVLERIYIGRRFKMVRLHGYCLKELSLTGGVVSQKLSTNLSAE